MFDFLYHQILVMANKKNSPKLLLWQEVDLASGSLKQYKSAIIITHTAHVHSLSEWVHLMINDAPCWKSVYEPTKLELNRNLGK